MTNQIRINDVVIYSAHRAGTSVNGNPQWQLNTSHGVFKLQADAQLGYAISNYTNSRFPDTFVIGNPDDPRVTLLATRANRVFGIERDGKVLR